MRFLNEGRGSQPQVVCFLGDTFHKMECIVKVWIFQFLSYPAREQMYLCGLSAKK